jgi:hypothetical protein
MCAGATVAWVTRGLGLQKASFYIDEALLVTGASLRDLDFPEGSSVTLHRPGKSADPGAGVDGAASGGIMSTCLRSQRTNR